MIKLIPDTITEFKWLLTWVIRFAKEYDFYRVFVDAVMKEQYDHIDEYYEKVVNFYRRNPNRDVGFENFFIYQPYLGVNYAKLNILKPVLKIPMVYSYSCILEDLTEEFKRFLEKNNVHLRFISYKKSSSTN